MKVYYQAEDLTIRELSRDGATGQWSNGTVIPVPGGTGATPYQGTSISAIGLDETHIRVYYQAADGSLWEASRAGTQWSVSEMTSNGKSQASKLGTPIAAAVQVTLDSVRPLIPFWGPIDNRVFSSLCGAFVFTP